MFFRQASSALGAFMYALIAIFVAAFVALTAMSSPAEEHRIESPDGTIAVVVSDDGGLNYRVEVDTHPILVRSQLGLEFAKEIVFGPAAHIISVERKQNDSTWWNRFGKRLVVQERWNQMHVVVCENDMDDQTFGVLVRVFDDGIAFRYVLGDDSQLGEFIIKDEQTSFAFADDCRCWMGLPNKCAENQYPETTLAAIPKNDNSGDVYQSVLPLLVETPHALIAVTESDVLDWAGMFLSGSNSEPTVRVSLAKRNDGQGCVVSKTPCVSPWRVLMIGRTAADLIESDLIANLATPCRLDDVSWIKPGLCAWDPWWTGVNPHFPAYSGLWARGNTRAHKDYIDFAAEMGWSYQLVDWFWYRNMSSFEVALNKGGTNPSGPSVDFAKSMPHIDLPEIFAHAKRKGVRLIIWLHSYDLDRYGIDRACKLFADMGAAGLKIDFMNSDSQETMQWYEEVIRTAAEHHLLIDFHGACKPSGLSRTYPNYITQEGVLGNEYNKLQGDLCTPLHTITLPFTRGLLGPMDFTPGGFLSVSEEDFRITSPTRVMGTRTRQLAMPVIYESPLTIFCDSPANYRGQQGLEFYRKLPTVWDETKVLSAEVAQHLVLARRSGAQWYLAAMNGPQPISLRIPLEFLGPGEWDMQSYADITQSDDRLMQVQERQQIVTSGSTLLIHFAPAGGFVAIASRKSEDR